MYIDIVIYLGGRFRCILVNILPGGVLSPTKAFSVNDDVLEQPVDCVLYIFFSLSKIG